MCVYVCVCVCMRVRVCVCVNINLNEYTVYRANTYCFILLYYILCRYCFIPRYVGPNMDMLQLYSMEDYASLPLTKWKIKQPASR